ncbi:MAG: hypothetical protein LQ342_007449 [Letrouitia transgressa]|nr:MAG: hypothetical protein LQ342_007449 [Letrouitia transgressa]
MSQRRLTQLPSPETVLLFPWMMAQSKHVAKYVADLQVIFSNATIIPFPACSLAEFTYKSFSAQAEELQPALNSIFEQSGHRRRLLVFAFSNGGCYHFSLFAHLWRQMMGKPLPVEAIIFDSAPGRGTWARISTALDESIIPPSWFLPFRMLAQSAVRFGVGAYILTVQAMGFENIVERVWKTLNDASVVDLKAAKGFVFSKSDRMVRYQDVEAHAEEAERLGWCVLKESFEDTGHAKHMLADGERYWAFINKVWYEGVQRSDDGVERSVTEDGGNERLWKL